MTSDRELDRLLSEWLQDGAYEAPEGPVDEAIAHARRSPRRPNPLGIFRSDPMSVSPSFLGLRPAVVLALLALLLAGLAIVGAGAILNSNRPGLVTSSTAPASSVPSPVALGTPAPSPSPSPCAAVVPAALQGTWTVVIGPSETGLGYWAPPGTWLLTFTSCTLQLEGGGHAPLPAATPVFGAGTLALPPDPTCASQSGTPTGGVYRYTVTATTLTFSEVGDSCPGRLGTFVAHPWHRQG